MIRQTIIAAALVAVASGTAYAEDKQTAPAEKPAVAKVVDNLDINFKGEVRAFVEGGNAADHDLEVKSTDTNVGVDVRSKGITYVFGHLSATVDITGTDTVNTNYGYVGVGHQVYGELSAGKTKSIMEEFVNTTDMFYSAGNQAVQKTTKKQADSVKYMNSFGDIKVGAQAQMTDNAADDNTLDTYQIGVGYKNVGVTFSEDQTNDTQHYGIGASHKFMDKITVAASYTIKDNDTTGVTRAVEAVVGYDLSAKTMVLAGLQKTDATGDDGDVTFEVNHKLYKDATVFANVDYDVASSDYVYRTGVSVKF
jgi:hypothetical protein